MTFFKRKAGLLALVLAVSVAAPMTPATAGNDAVWGAVGGLLAGKMISDHQQKKQAEAYRAGAEDQYVAQVQQQQSQPAAPTAEQRLARLKSLKDQGLISESDYNTQKAAIVSSL